MSASVFFEAIVPRDRDKFNKMRNVAAACDAAGLAHPQEVVDFFQDDDDYRVSAEKRISLYDHPAIQGEVEHGDGAIIDLTGLPIGTTKIRVYAA